MDFTSLSAVFKEQFPNGMPQMDLLFRKHVLLTMMANDTDFTGRVKHIPVIGNPGGGAGADFATAVAAASSPVVCNFDVPRATTHAVDYINGDLVRMSDTDESGANALIDALELSQKNLLGKLGNSCGFGAYRSNTGSLCQVNATTAPSGTTLTLDYPSSGRLFYPGMQVVASQTDGGALRNSGSSVTVQSVNEDAGTVIGLTNWSTITSIAVGDFLYRLSDAQNNATVVSPAGLRTWCPSVAPSSTSDNLYGGARYLMPNLFAGRRLSNTGESIETVFIKAQAIAQIAGFDLGSVFINPMDVARFVKAKEGVKTVTSDKYDIGVDAITAYGATFFPDGDCPEGEAWAVYVTASKSKNMGYRWMTNGKPKVTTIDGAPIARVPGQDKYEMRTSLDHNYGAYEPGKVIRIPIPNG